MALTFDPAKRLRTLQERGLDFVEAQAVFSGATLDIPDIRRDYGEERFATFGLLFDRLVVVVWTPRGEDRHVISMRKANEREQQKYRQRLA